jgi:G:T-mismatch repair DNA endonuclease (very short patch repair protein)
MQLAHHPGGEGGAARFGSTRPMRRERTVVRLERYFAPALTRVFRYAARALRRLGFRVETVWECEIEDPDVLARRARKVARPTVAAEHGRGTTANGASCI